MRRGFVAWLKMKQANGPTYSPSDTNQPADFVRPLGSHREVCTSERIFIAARTIRGKQGTKGKNIELSFCPHLCAVICSFPRRPQTVTIPLNHDYSLWRKHSSPFPANGVRLFTACPRARRRNHSTHPDAGGLCSRLRQQQEHLTKDQRPCQR